MSFERMTMICNGAYVIARCKSVGILPNLSAHTMSKKWYFPHHFKIIFHFFEESLSESNILNLLIEFNYDITRFDQYLKNTQVVINKESKLMILSILICQYLRCYCIFESRIRTGSSRVETKTYFGTKDRGVQKYDEDFETQLKNEKCEKNGPMCS